MISVDPTRQAWPSLAAIVVLFAAQADPHEAIEALCAVCGTVVLVDNAPGGNHPAAVRWMGHSGVHVVRHGNVGGLAGGYNAAIAALRRFRKSATHVVFVDEDSDVAVLRSFLSRPGVSRLLEASDTAAVAPSHRDRATGMRARHIQLSRWHLTFLPREVRGIQRVTFIINSMSVWRCEALRVIGPFDERLGVDHVDTDYCLRATLAGLSVYLDADFEFAHSIGTRRAYKAMGVAMQAGGHSAARRRSIGRSTTMLAFRYGRRFPAFAALCASRLLYETLGIAVAEDLKLTKIAALWRGVFDALRGR